MVPCSDRVSFLFAERGYLEVDGHAVVLRQGSGLTHFPVGSTTTIFIEPGTVVTHAAIKACAQSGCLLVWVGEGGVRLYSAGMHGNAAPKHILQQAKINLNESLRLKAASRVYQLMFNEPAPKHRSVNQLRGFEGSKVKVLYQKMAKNNGLKWSGRSRNMDDPLNRAISSANAALYGVTEAIILSLGYSPSIGLVHLGDRRSFVFDVADTVKFQSVVPMAIRLFAEGKIKNESDIRVACRDTFREMTLINKIVKNIQHIMDENSYD